MFVKSEFQQKLARELHMLIKTAISGMPIDNDISPSLLRHYDMLKCTTSHGKQCSIENYAWTIFLRWKTHPGFRGIHRIHHPGGGGGLLSSIRTRSNWEESSVVVPERTPAQYDTLRTCKLGHVARAVSPWSVIWLQLEISRFLKFLQYFAKAISVRSVTEWRWANWTTCMLLKLAKKCSRHVSSKEPHDSKWTSCKFVWWRAKVCRQPAVTQGQPLRLRTFSPLQLIINGWRLAGVKCLQHCRWTIFNLGLFLNTIFKTESSKKPQLSPMKDCKLFVFVARTLKASVVICSECSLTSNSKRFEKYECTRSRQPVDTARRLNKSAMDKWGSTWRWRTSSQFKSRSSMASDVQENFVGSFQVLRLKNLEKARAGNTLLGSGETAKTFTPGTTSFSFSGPFPPCRWREK